MSASPPSRLLVVSLVAVLCGLCTSAAAQTTGRDTGAAAPVNVSGAVSVTNKGISLIPSFTLGRPATIFDLAVRKGNVGFEPQFRFGVDGKPWSFLLWFRHRAVTGRRFRMTIGGHPSFSFRTVSASTGGAPRDLIQVRRYVAGEVTPTYAVSDTLSVGAYYLFSRGIDPDAARYTNFVAARVNLTRPVASARYTLTLAPQLYYLKTAGEAGVFAGTTITLARPRSPFSVSSVLNAPIQSKVTGGQAFLWNLSLTYAFR